MILCSFGNDAFEAFLDGLLTAKEDVEPSPRGQHRSRGVQIIQSLVSPFLADTHCLSQFFAPLRLPKVLSSVEERARPLLP